MIKNQQGFRCRSLWLYLFWGVSDCFFCVFSSSTGDSLRGDRYRALTEAQHMLERALASDLNGLEGIEWNETEQLVDGAAVHGRLISYSTRWTPWGRKLSAFKADSR